MPLTEMLFVPTGPRDDCIVCRIRPEILADSLQQGTMTLCIPHLLDVANHLRGVEVVKRTPPPPLLKPGVP